ncbi:MAG: tRNA (N6-threonylcarbamoyladenosine(37)-N6)-methyltransferase TrmO [Bacteroidales bacterium]
MQINYEPIGIIRSSHMTKEGVPIQSSGAEGCYGSVIVNAQLEEGLEDLEGFSHLILIYHFHQSTGYSLKPTPFMDSRPRGVFSTRAPRRPNSIGISVVRLIRIHDNVMEIENVDILDGTPLLDIKPYVPQFDIFKVEKTGWLENKGNHLGDVMSDDRFN